MGHGHGRRRWRMARHMEPDKHYFRVGLYLIGLTLAAALFTVWLVNEGEESDRKYRIYFAESVSGLSEGGTVKYRGVNVGTVETIRISTRDPRLIRVDVRIRESTPVKVDTMAALKLQGITGSVYIELSGGDPEMQDLTEVAAKNTVPEIPAQPSSITAIMNQLPTILDKLASFAEQMNKLTSDANIHSLSTAFSNLAESSDEVRMTLRDARGNLIDATEQTSSTMRNMRRASYNVNSLTETIKDNPSSLLFPSEEEGIPTP